MNLQPVILHCLHPTEGLINLPCSRFSVATVNLGHEEHPLSIPIPQRLAHAEFARAAIIVPAVVHEIDPIVNRGADDAYTLFLVGLFSDMKSAQADERHTLSCTPQPVVWHPFFRFYSP